MNGTAWLGALGTVALLVFAAAHYGAQLLLANGVALLFVVGGIAASCLLGFPLSRLASALRRAWALFFAAGLPTEQEAVQEILRLARIAQSQGGLLALARENLTFADGFLMRAVLAAVSTGDAQETRHMVEREIRKRRIQAEEDANVFRTVGVLSPMFGLLGTLLGMIRLMSIMQNPAQAGPAMAVALASAFFGICVANFVCVPVAGHMRLRAIEELVILDTLLEGVLDLLSSKPPAYISVHLTGTAERRREQARAQAVPA
ncbi:MAG: MotA/TolQ/ExbB proton channel family protein [Elusimicrobia bacterium]|nr:MotA/TolQ/ExbB proton channel family protein [Elusimicrobiota bacterium]